MSLSRGDYVRVGKGQQNWFVTFATPHHVIVSRDVPSRSGYGWRQLRRYFYGETNIAKLEKVSHDRQTDR